MHYLFPYNASAVVRFPLVKRASVDLAKSVDYATPANGDCNISKDGGAQANPANTINVVTGTTWNLTLSATEMSAKEVVLMVRNNTAVEDQWLTIRTFGNASAYYQGDITAANLAADLRQIVGAAVSGPATAGVLDVNVKNVNNVVANTNLVVDLRQIVGAAVSGPATAGVLDVNVKNVNNVVANTNLAVDLRQIVGAAVSGPAQAGILDVNIKNANNAVFNNQVAQFGAAVISFAANSLTAAAINSNAITGAKVANDVDIRNVNGNVGSVTNNVGGSVAGSVGSVTGNVGNVTGNIGGNLSGSVGSVTGNVAAVTGNIGGNLAGSVASVTGNVNAVTTNIGGNVAGSVGSVTGNVAGSVVGSVGSVVNNVTVQAIANNAITAVSINANAITGAKVGNDVDVRNVTGNVSGSVGSVTGAVGSVTGAVGSVTGNVSGSVVGSTGSVVNNVTVQAIANNAITAVSINANAIIGAKVGNDVDIRNVTGNVAGTVASVINLNAQLVDAAVSTRATPAQVKTQVVAGLSADTYGEPGQGNPAATTDLSTKIGYLFKFARNKVTQTNNTLSIFNDDNSTVDQKATVSDDGTTYTRDKVKTGP